MSGKPKQGIDFAGWDTGIFENDVKIDRLLDAQGWIGFGVYFYLCQRAYASNGYYYAWRYDDAPTTARKMGGGIGSNTVRNVVGLCLQIGLFDKDLFDRESILTSRGIQRRYAVAIQKRSCKTVDQRYWLLDEKESESLVVYAENAVSLPEDVHSLPEDVHSLPEHPQSKVKESKGNYTPPTPPTGGARVKELFSEWWKEYPKQIDEDECYRVFCRIKDIEEVFPAMMNALKAQKKTDGWQREYGRYVPNPLKWLKQKQWNYVPDHDERSFDIDDFFRASVEKSYRDDK